MATTTIANSTAVFSNSTAAANLTGSWAEDQTLALTFDVLAASGGGKNTILYSVDDGIKGDDNPLVTVSSAFATYDTDLLYKDTAGATWQLGGDTSAQGAHVWIGSDNKLHYDGSSVVSFQQLGAGETSTDTVLYTIRMSNGTLSVGHLTITINGANDGPVAVADTNSGSEDTIITGTVASNDSDVDHGASLSYSLNGSVAGLTLNADGSYSLDAGNAAYQHLAQGATHDVVASYTVTDEHGATSSSTLTITVTGTNDAPTAVADAASTPENTPITLSSLLGNDTDADGDSLTISAVTNGVHGSAVLNLDGSVTYTPNAGFDGSDSITYTVSDGNGGTDTGQVAITVTEAPSEPPTLTLDSQVIPVGSLAQIDDGGPNDNTVSETSIVNVANPIPIATADPDLDGIVSVRITDLTNANAFSTDGVSFNGTASFGGISAGQATVNLDHSITLTGDLSGLTITSTVASHDTLKVDAHNSEGGDTVGYIDWPVVSPVTFASLPGTFTGTGDPNDNDSQGAAGSQTINAGNQGQVLYGGAGADTLNGGNGADTLYGGSGNDILNGNNGGDTIYGGSGNDTINGGGAGDTITGGYGAETIDVGTGAVDTIRYLSLLDTNDTVSNFVLGQDKIDLSAIDADASTGGNDAFAWGGQVLNYPVVQAHAVTWYTNGTNVELLADTDGVLTTAEFHITLTGVTSLAQTDFNTL